MTMLLILTVLMLTCPPAQGQGDEHEEEEGCPGLGAGEEGDHFGVDDEGEAGAFCYHLYRGAVNLVTICGKTGDLKQFRPHLLHWQVCRMRHEAENGEDDKSRENRRDGVGHRD